MCEGKRKRDLRVWRDARKNKTYTYSEQLHCLLSGYWLAEEGLNGRQRL